ncbi:MAG TPA: universal stress protein [Kofleriaceae bacterium]|nr:universal stress protein [Kofleriaceae bacterium]
MRFKKLLVAVDFSQPANLALRAAAALAVESNAELTVAHVWQVPVLGAELPVPAQYIEEMRLAAEKQLATWTADATKLAGRPVTSAFVVGAPWDELCKLANKDGYDLIVIATHGRTGLKHVLLGSVAEKVVRHAPCAVLVVR